MWYCASKDRSPKMDHQSGVLLQHFEAFEAWHATSGNQIYEVRIIRFFRVSSTYLCIPLQRWYGIASGPNLIATSSTCGLSYLFRDENTDQHLRFSTVVQIRNESHKFLSRRVGKNASRLCSECETNVIAGVLLRNTTMAKEMALKLT